MKAKKEPVNEELLLFAANYARYLLYEFGRKDDKNVI